MPRDAISSLAPNNQWQRHTIFVYEEIGIRCPNSPKWLISLARTRSCECQSDETAKVLQYLSRQSATGESHHVRSTHVVTILVHRLETMQDLTLWADVQVSCPSSRRLFILKLRHDLI